MKTPVIILAFAQAPGSALLEVNEERRGIRHALQALHDKQFIEVYDEPGTALDDLFSSFSRFEDRICMFHFGGHAGQNELELEDQLVYAKGLAKLFAGANKQLQLVFLNGCSTAGQVRLLQEAGIKAVIATSRPVGDKAALAFAVELYRALANHRTLQQAFDRATARLHAVKPDMACRVQRGLALRSEQEELPGWGLYVQEDGAEKALNWTLPKVTVTPPLEVRYDGNFDEALVEIVEAMAAHNPNIGSLPPQWRRSQARMLTLQNFPWPLSAHLQILIAGKNNVKPHGLSRLRQLVETYVVSTRMMAYILLSQTWDLLLKKGSLSDIKAYSLALPNEDSYPTFDYLHLLRSCYRLLKDNGVEPVIAELEGSVTRTDEGGESFESYRFLESLRVRLLENDIPAHEAADLSSQTEAVLMEMLVKVAYLAGFKLLTIPSIRVNFPKRLGKRFSHRHFLLYTADIGFTKSEELDFTHFTNSQSIVLFPHTQTVIEDIAGDLDLSPFFIDKATYLGAQAPEIYAFAYRRSDGALCYQSVDFDINDNPDNHAAWQLMIDQTAKPYRIVWEQFDHFLKDFDL